MRTTLVTSRQTTGKQVSYRILELPIGPSARSLVEALRSGREGASTALVDRYAKDVERVLYRILGPDPEIDDLLHDVYVYALSSLHALRKPEALRGWLVAIAARHALKCIRGRKRSRIVRLFRSEAPPDPEASVVSPEVSEALRSTYAVLNDMRPSERVVFALRYIDRMELTAVADAVGVSLATVKRRIKRARESFVALARNRPALAEWLDAGDLAK